MLQKWKEWRFSWNEGGKHLLGSFDISYDQIKKSLKILDRNWKHQGRVKNSNVGVLQKWKEWRFSWNDRGKHLLGCLSISWDQRKNKGTSNVGVRKKRYLVPKPCLLQKPNSPYEELSLQNNKVTSSSWFLQRFKWWWWLWLLRERASERERERERIESFTL